MGTIPVNLKNISNEIMHSLIMSDTHPELAPGQAYLTSEFFQCKMSELSEKKLQLVDMSAVLTHAFVPAHRRRER
jgi:hypothetical protein